MNLPEHRNWGVVGFKDPGVALVPHNFRDKPSFRLMCVCTCARARVQVCERKISAITFWFSDQDPFSLRKEIESCQKGSQDGKRSIF